MKPPFPTPADLDDLRSLVDGFGAHVDPAMLHQQLTDALLDLALANAALERVRRMSEKRLAWCVIIGAAGAALLAAVLVLLGMRL